MNNEYTVLLKTLYSGLSNGSERNKMMGGNYSKGSWPDRIAYQHISEVVECGVSVSRFAVGDVVFTGTYLGHVPLHLAREDDLMVKLLASMDLPAAALMGVASVSMRDARLVLVAGRERVGFNFNAASGRRLATYSTAHFEQSDLEQVLRLAQKGVIHLRELVRDVVPIGEAVSVYDTLRVSAKCLIYGLSRTTGGAGWRRGSKSSWKLNRARGVCT
ncbi:MAG: hypothetical protein ACKVJG_19395 [Candidatus Latescibacterota bacterium]